jgi:hypothetical protein
VRCVVCDALPGGVVVGDRAFHRLGTRRVLLVAPPRAATLVMGYVQTSPHAIIRLAPP